MPVSRVRPGVLITYRPMTCQAIFGRAPQLTPFAARCYKRNSAIVGAHIGTVGVAQLVERQTVDLDVAGSNPVTHPMFSIT